MLSFISELKKEVGWYMAYNSGHRMYNQHTISSTNFERISQASHL